MKNLFHRLPFWLVAFAIIFLFTQLPPALPTKLVWLGLPNWLYWLAAIHALFILTFYIFTVKYWK